MVCAILPCLFPHLKYQLPEWVVYEGVEGLLPFGVDRLRDGSCLEELVVALQMCCTWLISIFSTNYFDLLDLRSCPYVLISCLNALEVGVAGAAPVHGDEALPVAHLHVQLEERVLPQLHLPLLRLNESEITLEDLAELPLRQIICMYSFNSGSNVDGNQAR